MDIDTGNAYRAEREPGDYAAWGSGIHHRWQCVRRATIITVRCGPAA